MRKLFFQLSVIALVFSACQKEVSLEDPDAEPGTGGGGNVGTRLVRTGTRLGIDSVTIDYTYTTANQLTGIQFSGTLQGQPLAVQQKINRNPANVITSVVIRSPLLPMFGFGEDSLVVQPVFDAAAGRYIRSLTKFVLDGESYTDSTVYSFSTTGKVSSALVYFNDGSGYFPGFRSDFAFSENNLVEKKEYETDGTNFELIELTTFQHDDKVNPISLPAEAPFLMFSNVYMLPFGLWLQMGLNDFYSVNNMSQFTTTDISTSASEETTITYTYNSRNLPETSARTIGGLPLANTRYFYQ